MDTKSVNKPDIRAFESLFRRMQPKLFAFCRKYIDDEECARDIVQECFIGLWEHYAENICSCESYLFRSVHNRCLSYIRSQKVSAAYEETVRWRIREIELHPEPNSPLVDLYVKELNGLIHHTVEKLPAKCRKIFEMSRFHGLRNHEIAETLGLSVRTVEVQIYNALKIFKTAFNDYLPILLIFFSFFAK
ncbi:RNA polymerase sigma-70 factor [Tannerella sp.]|uniref:RNA polymerase sigma-70 factor n=1 Tax=Tannerella sp. TaxID=2382127 RepID=UPI0026DB5B72|nr:RNA polymerase sigma-70 factor [Tannerella sp.]MDO4702775.1 RNA polymerase sigma-70 factor [Tannerella sp.]